MNKQLAYIYTNNCKLFYYYISIIQILFELRWLVIFS